MNSMWDDFVDDPLGIETGGYGSWLCLECNDDGELDELVDGRCPHCSGEVELT